MIFGMSTATYTFIHVVISLGGIFSGFMVMYGLLTSKRLDGWTALFLATTVATSVTGYGFPTDHLLPSQVVGAISLIVLTVAIVARYGRHLAGAWRKIYVITSSIALYLNVFVLIVQAFLKVPSLKALAPTQHEPPFLVAQLGAMALFVVLAIAAVIKFPGWRGPSGLNQTATVTERSIIMKNGPVKCLAIALISCLVALLPVPAFAGQVPQSRFADVNGVRLHYLIAGRGDPVVLLHGYAETSHMWLPLMKELAKTHTVIAPDLRGAGESSTPAEGYTKAVMAQDIHALAHKFGYEHIQIVGHDIGLMVAYAYAAQYPGEVDRIVLMDAFLPGVGNWRDVWLMRDLWHFHFYGRTPLALVHGRERIYFEHFWNDFAADPTHSVSERDRRIYAAAYAQPDHMRAGFEYFRAFERDAQDFAGFAKTPLPMRMLVLSGEKASGEFLIQQGRLVATNVEGVVVRGSGHWLMEEAPDQVTPKLLEFLNRAMTPVHS